MGPPMVGWTDVASWSVLLGVALEPWEARLLVRLGTARAIAMNEKQKANAKAPPAPKGRRR